MNLLPRFKSITTFVFDIDGVLTDGTVLLFENGLQARRMNIKDGLALQMAMRNGFRVVVLSGAFSEPVVKRMEYLGLTDIHCSVKDKKSFLENFMKEHQISRGQILFMGDDLPDLNALSVAGLACCPADAVSEIKEACDYISPLKGGNGCVRDVIEKVLRLNDKWIFEEEVSSI